MNGPPAATVDEQAVRRAPPSRPRKPIDARRISLAVAVAVWVSWWWAAYQGYSDSTQFSLWAATLFLFAASLFEPWRVSRPDNLTALALVVIAAAMLPRVLGAEFAPYEITLDEAIHPLLGREILLNEPWMIFKGVADHFATPYLDLVLQGALPGIHGARTMSAIFAAVSLLTTYALASHLYDRKTATFALLFLGCAYWHAAFARTGYPFLQPVAIITLAFWILIRGLEEENKGLLFAGGMVLGASLLIYTPGRIVVPVFAIWWLLNALAGRFRWRTLLPVALGLVVFVSPYLQLHGTWTFLARYLGTIAGPETPAAVAASSGWLSAATWTAFIRQAETAVRIFTDGYGWMAPHSIAPGPLLDRLTLGLAVAGLSLSVLHLRRAASLLLLLWVGAIFVGGQILTDVPQAAYRAAPMLPALAIAAGGALEWVIARLCRPFRWRGNALRVAFGLMTVAYIGPVNLTALQAFIDARSNSPLTALGRTVAHGDPAWTYFVVDTTESVTDPRFQISAGDRAVRAVSRLSDLLGAELAEMVGPRTKGAAIILGPPLRTAEETIRRCYPGAVRLPVEYWSTRNPPVVLFLGPQAIASGRECELSLDDERGLRASYFRGNDFTGGILRKPLEDWTVQWVGPRPEEFGSVEWRGYLNVPISGFYRLHLASDSIGSTASIGKTVIEAGALVGALLKRRIYPLTLRFRAQPRTHYALFWAPPGGELEAIPPSLLSPYPRNRSDQRQVN